MLFNGSYWSSRPRPEEGESQAIESMFAGSIDENGLVQVRRGDAGGGGPVEEIGTDLDDAVSADGEVCHAQLIARVHGNDVTDSGWREQLLRLVCDVHLELGGGVEVVPEHEVRAGAVQDGEALSDGVICFSQRRQDQTEVGGVGVDVVEQRENVRVNDSQIG